LLLVVFTAVNAAVLVLRRDRVGHDHFHVPVVVPWLGIGSCLLLFTQIEADVWLRGLVLIAIGLLLATVNAVRARRGHLDDSFDDSAVRDADQAPVAGRERAE
jgi:hypothetical protein